MNKSKWMPLTNIRHPGMGRPWQIRFSDGCVMPLRNWIDLLRTTATWLVSNRMLTPKNAQVQIRGRYVSSNTAQQVEYSERIFRYPENDTDIYISNKWGSKAAVDAAVTLLEHCGADPSAVLVYGFVFTYLSVR